MPSGLSETGARCCHRREPDRVHQATAWRARVYLEATESKAFTIFAGTANPELAVAIARGLGVQVGACHIDRFPDGEVAVQLLEPVRRKEVFLVQPTSPPVNDHLVELLALADACRRAAAARITAILPYFGYARADKRHGRREPITGRVVADLLQVVGIAHAEPDSGRRYIQREQPVRPIARVFEFPVEIDTDHVQTTLENGILKIHIPKAATGRRKVIRVGQSA